ncbi:valine--tRNA ligase [uncultured Nitrospira sp.]|uniref:valine--tRNA ligase n=1 Tax=uncultured Nitrospira sp. TaxID=157176 RepID=UPI0031400DDA
MASSQLEKTYNPGEVENRWGSYWIEHQFFQPDPTNLAPSFSLVIPPPNVTGSLHIGHALNTTIQDIIVRWRRMQGLNTLWIPGTDHAGIATQNVVERQLAQEGQTREHLGRPAFIDRVWKWRHQSGDTIIEQLKQLGASCDWTRLRFTMDEGLSLAVREVFVRLYEEGLIYRGERLINWCSRCLTALSDIEVEHEPTKGKLYHIPYFLVDDPTEFLIVATTRPETILGDTAVAVHPEDPRYQKYIGQEVQVPLTTRTIPVVADPILVDREFGTGAVKITPAHDFNDFEAGERHGLPRLGILDFQARMSPMGLQEAQADPTLQAELNFKSVQEARAIVIEALERQELLSKVEDHAMAIGKCYRCKTVTEPYLSPQWFVKIQPLATPAIQAVEAGDIRIIPDGWKNNYLGWMRQIKDWCISRQIWWGHQIPAWYCRNCNKDHLPKTSQAGEAPDQKGIPSAQLTRSCFIASDAQPIVSRTPPQSCPTCGGTNLFQDPDVLDTWFSSALWPFSTLGWPENTEDLKTFYPTATLVTGLDILFFWVARMIMMGLKFTGKVPFRDVYIHALVRDAEGQKMSKSKGNVIDPLTKMRQYGTDALRFTLASMASPGRDIKLAEERIEGYRNFVTKLWNAARFIHLYADGPRVSLSVELRPFPDRWILSRLNHTIHEVTKAFEDYRFDQAASALYQFIWHEYCDWFIELAKACLQQENHPDAPATRQTLLESFEIIQRLLHPVMPFITEEIWQSFPHEGPSIMTQNFPTEKPEWTNAEAEQAFSLLQAFVNTARTGRAFLNISPSQAPSIYGVCAHAHDTATMGFLTPYIESILRSSVITDQAIPPLRTLQLPSGHFSTIGIPVPNEIDLHEVVKKIQKQIGEKEKEVQRLGSRLSSPEFREKAESSVIQESEDRRTKLIDELGILNMTEQQLVSMTT